MRLQAVSSQYRKKRTERGEDERWVVEMRVGQKQRPVGWMLRECPTEDLLAEETSRG